MAQYFQAIRIDHILGFFRIWEIPVDYRSGLMGHFSPAYSIHRNELEREGIWVFNRLTYPYIPTQRLHEDFNSKANSIIKKFFQKGEGDKLILKEEFNTEKKITEYLQNDKFKEEDVETIFLKEKLIEYSMDVCLLKNKKNPENEFSPKISLEKSYSFQKLDKHIQTVLLRLHDDYYYNRQEGLWEKVGFERLPVVKSSDMFVCGEDLGMLPKCIFSVLRKLSILSLRIQRMPPEKDHEFGYPPHYPYMSVCSTSSHDCSTIRGWWEEDRAKTQLFFNTTLGEYGEAPPFCEPWICKKIIEQHMWAPSMWAIFPIQDLFALREDLRVSDPTSEQINIPSDPDHYWRYRIHVNIEDLIENKGFFDTVREIVVASGRY